MRKYIQTELTFFIQQHREKPKGRLFSELQEDGRLFYSKEKEKLKTGDYRNFIGGRHLQWFFSCDEGENSWKLFEKSICDDDSYGVADENFDGFLEKGICDGDSHGVADENFGEFLKQSICDDDSHGVADENFDGFLKQSICDGDSHGVEDENFGEFLEKGICNKDFQNLKIPFISRKYLQV